MNQLYPIKFKPILKDTIWGGKRLKTKLNKAGSSDKCGESWEIADVHEDISIVSNGFLAGNDLKELIEIYMGDLVGDKVYEQFGNQFPLLIKFIDANDVLSIQVHPDDKLAKKRHNSFGKTEMWYIIESEPDSELICGFNQAVDKDVYLKHLEEGTLNKIMNFEKVESGDVLFIPAGRVHAIGSGILLAEIQQSSDITYRIYDWNRIDERGNSRELHTDLALDAIDYKVYDKYKSTYDKIQNRTVNIVNSPYFFTNVLAFDKAVEKDYNLVDSFVIYMCVGGKFRILPENGEPVDVKMGETVLLPAVVKNLTLEPQGQSKVLEVYIK